MKTGVVPAADIFSRHDLQNVEMKITSRGFRIFLK